jgi:hypothetical protein
VYVEIAMLETGLNTGTFTATLQTRNDIFQEVFFTGPQSTINISPGQTLRFIYTNVGPNGPKELTALVNAQIVGMLKTMPSVVRPGDSVRVMVLDEDADSNQNAFDTVEVFVTSISRGNAEPEKVLTLVETGESTGIFEGLMYTAESSDPAPLFYFSTVNVLGGERVLLTYGDVLPIVQVCTISIIHTYIYIYMYIYIYIYIYTYIHTYCAFTRVTMHTTSSCSRGTRTECLHA